MAVQKFKTNLNCGSCVAAVRPHLDHDPAIERWSVDTDSPDKTLTIEGEEIDAARVEEHVARAGFRVLGPIDDRPVDGKGTTFLSTYRPLLLVLAYLVGVVALIEILAGSFQTMRAMSHFMGGFFLAFSLFKLLDLPGFVDAFQTYDVLARRWRGYGYAYPFIELSLGIGYLGGLWPRLTNVVTLIVMAIGLVGVTGALVRKQQVQCACLGTVFNLPMSKVTFLEDALMAGMAALMLAMY